MRKSDSLLIPCRDAIALLALNGWMGYIRAVGIYLMIMLSTTPQSMARFFAPQAHAGSPLARSLLLARPLLP